MSEPFIGEIRMFAGNFPPRGWAFCDGQLLPISIHQALFSLLGTTYGGDGMTTFALPDLRGRVPIHAGTGPGLPNYSQGSRGGTERVTLTTAQLASHSHPSASSNPVSQTFPAGGVLGNTTTPLANLYASDAEYPADPATPMAAEAQAEVGGDQPHDNMMPFLAIHFIIALWGIYPSRS